MTAIAMTPTAVSAVARSVVLVRRSIIRNDAATSGCGHPPLGVNALRQMDELRTAGRAGRVQGHEVGVAGHVDEVGGELGRPPEEARGVRELLEDVARMARPQPEVLAAVVREDL